jgi:hypothetical protein
MTEATEENIQVSLVPKEYVNGVWPEVKDYIAAAVKQTDGRYHEDDVLNLLIEHNYLLWVAFTEEKMQGAVVTCFLDYPRKKALHVMFLGGVGAKKWKNETMRVLQDFARDSDCTVLETSGKFDWEDSWSRVFKDDGFRPLWQTYEVPVLKQG